MHLKILYYRQATLSFHRHHRCSANKKAEIPLIRKASLGGYFTQMLPEL